MTDTTKSFKFWCPADYERIDYVWNPDKAQIEWEYEGVADTLTYSHDELQKRLDEGDWCVIIEEGV